MDSAEPGQGRQPCGQEARIMELERELEVAREQARRSFLAEAYRDPYLHMLIQRWGEAWVQGYMQGAADAREEPRNETWVELRARAMRWLVADAERGQAEAAAVMALAKLAPTHLPESLRGV